MTSESCLRVRLIVSHNAPYYLHIPCICVLSVKKEVKLYPEQAVEAYRVVRC
jgi:hypothetical protein